MNSRMSEPQPQPVDVNAGRNVYTSDQEVNEETVLPPPNSHCSNVDIPASPNTINSPSDQESQFEFSPTMQFPCESPRLNLN